MSDHTPPSIFDDGLTEENPYRDYPEAQSGSSYKDAPPDQNPYKGFTGDSPESPGGSSPGPRAPSPGESRALPVRKSLVTAVSAQKLLKMDLPPRRLLMAPWLPEQGIAMIYAARGIGKTFLALEIALAVATGTDFQGWATDRAERVLYIDGEMSASDLQSRTGMMLRDRVFPAEGQLQFITPEMQDETPPDLSLPHWHRHLAPFVEQAKLIIVDNISSLCRTGNENDADSWQVVQQWAIRQKSSGKSVLFIHHAGKGGNQRGTSKREDVMDSVISLKRPDDYTASQGARFEVHYEKSRGFSGEAAKPFVVQLEESEGQYRWQSDSLEETVYQQVARLLKEGIEQKDIAEELGINKSTVSRHAKRARQEGGI